MGDDERWKRRLLCHRRPLVDGGILSPSRPFLISWIADPIVKQKIEGCNLNTN